jgi:AraC-like DNA-binding protein
MRMEIQMTDSDPQSGTRFLDHDHLRETLLTGGHALNVFKHRALPLDVTRIVVHASELAKIAKVSGAPARVSRARGEIALDDGAFLGVLFQKTGRTLCDFGSEQMILNSGDLLIWHGRSSVCFEIPESFREVCILLPLDTFESMLPEANSYAGTHLQKGHSISSLLGGCLSTLTDDVLANEMEPAGSAIALTLELIGAALTKHRESNNLGQRMNLYQRLTAFIERRLGDPELSPTMLARTHNISTRYLHLIFSERATTVGRWIRLRRLAQCRAELASLGSDCTVTEIAIRWCFSDVAHFSRLFRLAYGVSPREFRLTHRQSRR